MKRALALFTLVLLGLLLPPVGSAEIQMDGYFIARDSCPALHSIRKNTNPGDIHLTVDMVYELLSKNKADASHYRIRVKQASPKERWIPVACGTLLMDCRESSVAGGPSPSQPTGSPGSPVSTVDREYLLALSWQPTFCQTHQSKAECQTQTPERYDASHFTLHGLWPQPKNNIYCNVSNNAKKLDQRKMWAQLPELGLTEETFGDLIETMPGVASYLHRHEWIKHGTCYSPTTEEYFRESIMLAEQVNASEVRNFFADNIGKRIQVSAIKAKFDAAFGPGAGNKVRIKCNDGMISEMWINLSGEIDGHSKLSDLLIEADPASSSCDAGIVDPVGF